jgi:hypothetical protein
VDRELDLLRARVQITDWVADSGESPVMTTRGRPSGSTGSGGSQSEARTT